MLDVRAGGQARVLQDGDEDELSDGAEAKVPGESSHAERTEVTVVTSTCPLQNTVSSECRQVAKQKCDDLKREKCNQKCDPVYWCKICD